MIVQENKAEKRYLFLLFFFLYQTPRGQQFAEGNGHKIYVPQNDSLYMIVHAVQGAKIESKSNLETGKMACWEWIQCT